MGKRRGYTIQDIVNDDEWQELRRSLVGTWKKYPERNITILREYLLVDDNPLRVLRVYNYLTGSAFRIGKVQHEAIDQLLKEVRSNVADAYSRLPLKE